MSQSCPVCGSSVTGGSPKSHKNYTADHGRLDIDFNRCHACMSFWDEYHYVREERHEIHDVHVKDGRSWINGAAQGDPITCLHCRSTNVMFLQDDGPWRNQYDVRQRRYECKACDAIWVAMTHTDGAVVGTRIWRKGVIR